MTYSFIRYVAGKPHSIVAAKAHTVLDAIDKLSQAFNGVFLLIRKV